MFPMPEGMKIAPIMSSLSISKYFSWGKMPVVRDYNEEVRADGTYKDTRERNEEEIIGDI
jgi:hypothetical protein